MDEDHLLTAARYVELNPVRAGAVQAPSRYSWRSSAVAHPRGRGLSRRRFHGGFHAYLLLLIDCWGPLSHRPSATRPITSHEAVWPCPPMLSICKRFLLVERGFGLCPGG